MKLEEIHSVNDAEQCLEKEKQQSGNDYGRAHRSYVQRRDAVPIGDDIAPVGESCVDVKRGNEEEESLEEGIPFFEVMQKNLTSSEGQEPEDCGHADYRIWCVVCVKDRCAGKHLPVEPWEKEEGRE